jgi:hypothetical protein
MDRWVCEGFAEEISEVEARKIGQVVSGFVVHESKRRMVPDYIAQNEVLGARTFRMDPIRPGAAVETRRRPVLSGRRRRLPPFEAKTLRPEQFTLPNRETLVPTASTQLRPVTRTTVVYKVPRTCCPGTTTTGTPHHFILGRPLRSATYRPWGHSGTPGRCRTGGPGNSTAVWGKQK